MYSWLGNIQNWNTSEIVMKNFGRLTSRSNLDIAMNFDSAGEREIIIDNNE